MQHGVLHAPDVEVHRHPVPFGLRVPRLGRIVRVQEAQKIPAASSPLGHGVGFPQGRLTRGRFGRLHPVLRGGQRRLAGSGWAETLDFGQEHGQILGRDRLGLSVYMENRKRLAPIPLATEQPVPELIVHRAFAVAVFLQPGLHPFLGLGYVEAVQKAGVHMGSVSDIGSGLDIPPSDHLNNRDVKLPGKLPVPLVSTRHGHNRPGAIGEQDIVGDPNRNRLAINGIQGIAARIDPGLFLHQLRAGQIGLA